jgi:hypothetical protein
MPGAETLLDPRLYCLTYTGGDRFTIEELGRHEVVESPGSEASAFSHAQLQASSTPPWRTPGWRAISAVCRKNYWYNHRVPEPARLTLPGPARIIAGPARVAVMA